MLDEQTIRAEIRFYEDLRRQYRKKIMLLPAGKLFFRYDHGKWRPYIKANGRERYLNRNEDAKRISGLLEKLVLEKSVTHIDRNLKSLKDMETQFIGLEEISPDAICRQMEMMKGRGFRASDFLLDHTILQSVRQQAEKWAQKAGVTNPFKRELLQHTTPGGVMVRSKSELLIGTFLELKKHPYKYEEQLIVEGNEWYPDFKIPRLSDGKLILWEHMGLMDESESYREKNQYRLSVYARNGFYIGRNLIVTYDEHGALDMTIIEKIYELMLK